MSGCVRCVFCLACAGADVGGGDSGGGGGGVTVPLAVAPPLGGPTLRKEARSLLLSPCQGDGSVLWSGRATSSSVDAVVLSSWVE